MSSTSLDHDPETIRRRHKPTLASPSRRGAARGPVALSIYLLVRMSISEVSSGTLNGDWPLVGAANFIALLQGSELGGATLRTATFVVLVTAVGVVGGLVPRSRCAPPPRQRVPPRDDGVHLGYAACGEWQHLEVPAPDQG